MLRIAVLGCWVCVAGCRDSSPRVASTSPAPVPVSPVVTVPASAVGASMSPSPDAAVPDSSTSPDSAPVAATSCNGADQRAYGSTCCFVNPTEDKIPGMVFLSCSGPQIGKPCRARGDCDVVCSCDPPDAYLGGGTPPRGPADGTRGAVGHCGGRLQVGTFMCQIDEHGTVGHIIVD